MLDGSRCEGCGGGLAPGALACPACRRLVHGDRLRELSAVAECAERAGDGRAALAAWREARTLLPAQSRQLATVDDRVAALATAAEPAASTRSKWAAENEAAGWGKAGAAGLGTAALLLFKFKFAAIFLLAKAKFLLLGLTKLSTFFSMFASFGFYWARYGWPLGLGLVLSIYVHEMGHVYMLTRYGIKADAPLFIPGFGALVRVWQNFSDPREDARVGLAGPAWGLGAAVVCAAAAWAFGLPVLGAVAHLGAFINLFNLIPVWQLDGGRAFNSLSRPQRWLATAAVAAIWAGAGGVPVLVLLALGGVYRGCARSVPAEPDGGALAQYVGLVAAFCLVLLLPVGR